MGARAEIDQRKRENAASRIQAQHRMRAEQASFGQAQRSREAAARDAIRLEIDEAVKKATRRTGGGFSPRKPHKSGGSATTARPARAHR